jgi:hypothetical protein
MSGCNGSVPSTQIQEGLDMTKKITGFYGLQVIGLFLALSIAGCYTQLGSVRGEGEETEGYQQPPEQGYYETPADSNMGIINNYYFGGYLPSPYYRFSFSYYYPSYYWGWYNDPFFSDCYDPFFYNPWICGTPFVTYGYPGWYYHNYGFGYPYYGAGFYYYPRGHYGAGEAFGGTRNFGSTRGSTRGLRETGPTREIGYVPPPAIPVSLVGTSTITSPAGSRSRTPAAVVPSAGSGRTNRGERTGATVGRAGSAGQSQGQSGGRNTGSTRGTARPGRRQSIFPPQYIPPANVSPPSGTGNQGRTGSGGRGSSAPRAPQSAPSYSPPSSGGSHGGGSRGGSSGGGGGSRGGSGGGGRSSGGSRGR